MTDRRANARRRGYDARWERAAASFKDDHPLCVGCLATGQYSCAEAVDHIVPHKGDDRLFWDQGNWQPACIWHHNVIKQQLEIMWSSGVIAADQLRLDSPTAIRLTTRAPRRAPIGPDGWPV